MKVWQSCQTKKTISGNRRTYLKYGDLMRETVRKTAKIILRKTKCRIKVA